MSSTEATSINRLDEHPQTLETSAIYNDRVESESSPSTTAAAAAVIEADEISTNEPIITEQRGEEEEEEEVVMVERQQEGQETEQREVEEGAIVVERQQEQEQQQEEEEQEATPVFMERKRHHFSYDSNELRRRNTSAYSKIEPTSSTGATNTQSSDGGFYECNICFDTATHPVLTLCGHLFCWSCLAQWLNAQSRNPTCPVCKAGCGKDKVIPVYGRGREEKDPRNDPSIPTRPAGQRPPPIRDPNRPHTSFFGQGMRGNTYYNSTFSTASIGIFPFAVSFNFPVGGANDFQTQAQQNAFMSRLFLMVLSLIIVFLIFS
ncbi:unnamed protein product [Cunninghamella blakesleeana]